MPPEACKLTPNFTTIAVEPSADWVRDLTVKCETLRLFSLSYEVLWRDSSLNWSKVVSIANEGILLSPGLRTALLEDSLAEKRRLEKATRMPAILRVDPLAPPKRGSRRNAAGRTGGRSETQRATRGRGRRMPNVGAAGTGDAGSDGCEDAAGPDQGELAQAALAGAGQEAAPEGHPDIFDLEDELAGLVAGDLEELVATFSADAPPTGVVDGEARAVDGQDVLPGVLDALGEALAEAAAITGMAAEGEEPDQAAPNEPSASASAGPAGDALPPPCGGRAISARAALHCRPFGARVCYRERQVGASSVARQSEGQLVCEVLPAYRVQLLVVGAFGARR